MAERALPAAPAPRTVTVRVRPLLVVVAVLVVAAAVVWSLQWATGLQPISAGTGGTAPIGLTPVAHTNDTYDTGPTVYRWHRGGRYVVSLYLHNSASVPITITGADRTFADWEGEFTGPTLGLTDEHQPSRYTPFHPVRISADGYGWVSFVFTANPRACAHPEDKTPGTSIQDSVTVHFTTLGILHGTQTVPLGWATVDMAAPSHADCAQQS